MTLLNATPDYTILHNTEEGTEERGIAVMKMVLDYCYSIVLDSLEINNRCRRDGTHDTGFSKAVLWNSVLMKADLDDKTLVPLLTDCEVILDRVLDILLDKGEVNLNEDGTYSATWTPDPVDGDDEIEKDYPKINVDGVEYPLVTKMSPKQVVMMSEKKEMFDLLYPAGDYNMVQSTARHIREDMVTATEHSGAWFYTYNQ